MPNPWFRLYAETIDDWKIRSLAFEDRWHFVAILCLKCAGELDNDDVDDRMMSIKLGVRGRDLDNLKERLIDVSLIGEDWQPLGWDDRQYISDSSTARVRKYREKNKKKRGNGDETLRNGDVTAQDTDTDTDTDTNTDKRERGSPPSKIPPADFQPNEIHVKQLRAKRPDLDIPTVLELFKNTEYQYPRSNWDAAFFKFALTQRALPKREDEDDAIARWARGEVPDEYREVQ